VDDDLVAWPEAVAKLGEDLAWRLVQFTAYRDLEGRPCWDRERLEELLEMWKNGLLR
jgi:hypothetical protein